MKSRVEPLGSRRAQAAASSARRERPSSLSATSGCAANKTLAAQPDSLDQAPHEDICTALLHRGRGGSVELEEGLDPLPRLGRDLGTLQRRLAAGDEVELATAGDSRQPRQVGRAQLNRRSRQRPRRRRRVVWIRKHSQPGDRVAHLRPLEQRRRTGEMERDTSLFHRRAPRVRRGRDRRPSTQISSGLVPRPADARPPARQLGPAPAHSYTARTSSRAPETADSTRP